MRILPTILLFFLITLPLLAQDDFYSQHWSQVYKFEVRSLPQSALAVVDQIYAKAKRDNNIPQLTKALIYQSKFVLSQEDAELHIINKWKEEIEKSPFPLKNILENVLANLYWQYYKENRWKYYNRSSTSEIVNETDFRTWDADAMFREIHHHYQRSIKDPDLLQTLKIDLLDEILIKAENSKSYRPTLFDFLAHNALDFYRTKESNLKRFENDFELTNPAYFESIDQMLLPADSLSPAVNSIKILKLLLDFHKKDQDPTAYVNLELERLQFLVEESTIVNKNHFYKTALTKLRSTYQEFPVSALIDFELATLLHTAREQDETISNNEANYKKREALALCDEVIKRFEKSEGAEKCKILREHILRQRIELMVESHVPTETYSRIKVEYLNIDSISFTTYKVSPDFHEKFYRLNTDSARKAALASIPHDTIWQVRLQNLEDYQTHSTELILPPLANGRYLILCSVKNASSNEKEIFAYTTIQATNLALIEAVQGTSFHRYQLIDRHSGRPIEGANIHFESTTDAYNGSTVSDEHGITDKDGFIKVKRLKKTSRYFKATVTYNNEQAIFGNYYIYQAYEFPDEKNEEVTAKAFLFTDRSIYRPGQTVYFKGILIKRKSNKSDVVQGQYVNVYLEDVNGEDVGDLRLKTNAYGSFSGEFKLPTSGLTGEFTIYVDEDGEDTSKFWDNLYMLEHNEFSISVEEYKRPTFEVNIDAVTETFKLMDSVSVKGTAASFSGAKVGGAAVSYHVKRTVRYPHWYYWGARNNYSPEKEIAFGKAMTDKDGLFTLSFVAMPDENVSKDVLPVFHYEVSVSITDINGETRGASRTINVGYHSLQATLHMPEIVNRKITENNLRVTLENLNNQPVASTGVIRFYKIKTPPAPFRPRPWMAPDLPSIGAEEFSVLFPNDIYENESDPRNPQKGALMAEVSFNTEQSNEVKWSLTKAWPLGGYIVELHTKDKEGETVSDLARFTLTEPGDKSVHDNQLFLFEMDKPGYKVGDVAKLRIGSAAKDASFTIDIHKKGKDSKTYVERIGGNTKEISIPITTDMLGGFVVEVNGVKYNTFWRDEKRISVIEESAKIAIETITFKDKLQPGAKETWSFEITGKDQRIREAEVLASMYDASLDQFKNHDWQFQPNVEDYFYNNNRVSANQSFGTANFTVRNQSSSYYNTPNQFFDELDWFGFSLTNNYSINQRYLNRLYSTGIPLSDPSKVTMTRDKNLKKGIVSGRILSAEDGSPLAGVNVVVKGTTHGTVTDENGNYMLEADKGDELVFSFIGLASVDVKVGNRNIVDVSMTMDVTQLSEVVVTAMGVAVERKLLASAIAEVTSAPEESDVVFKSVESVAYGVQVTGMPGGTVSLAIRGTSALGNDKLPLYVIDGVIVKSTSIDQQDIATIQVLKGNAATSLYGVQAANGVIIIMTKSGQKKMDEEMAKVNVRKNFKETAFFFPHLSTDMEGRVRFTFETPESLTRWKLQLLAHTKDLLSATQTLQAVTQKELMVTPNSPRFLRVQDEIIFSAKISNLTPKVKSGNASLQLTNAITGESVDAVFKNSVRNKPFKVLSNGSTEVSWTLQVPAGIDALQYKIVAKAGNFSDGEQNVLPVLSNRVLVTETMPMYVRSGESKTFTLEKLKSSNSKTLQHHQLTLEVTSNPAWYAVQALPYLMEYPHECAEQIFARYYANILATHVINSNPKIKAVFDQWASAEALVSELEKNPELKSIIIQETPWLRDAKSESEQKKRVALLFDLNTMDGQLQSALDKLEGMQLSNGGFSWFSGSQYPNRYITQHIASGLGHLKKLNITSPEKATGIRNSAISFLDNEILKDYNNLVEQALGKKVNNLNGQKLYDEFMSSQHINTSQIQYLYMRSFYPEVSMSANVSRAIEYYKKQSGEYWKSFGLYMKGMIALIHHREQNSILSKAILQSLKENSISSEEMGMYWKENNSSWAWYESPIETHALLIEAFAEIENSDAGLSNQDKQKTIDELRIWLLKNKQTSQWKTTKATTEAIYALLLNGTEWLTLENQIEVSVGKNIVKPGQRPEAGTGYFKNSWKGDAITPSMSEVKLTKNSEGIAWAGLYWQYFEDLDNITSSETSLKLAKKVFVVNQTDKGELLTEIKSGMGVDIGSLLRIRIELKSDRMMEFLHMKDMRASGFEPVDVLSEYKWQDGLGYYQSTKDASTNFFFEVIKPGVYVFEYDLRINAKGDFSNGITSIECMYAPEFTSHSGGIRISVK